MRANVTFMYELYLSKGGDMEAFVDALLTPEGLDKVMQPQPTKIALFVAQQYHHQSGIIV